MVLLIRLLQVQKMNLTLVHLPDPENSCLYQLTFWDPSSKLIFCSIKKICSKSSKYFWKIFQQPGSCRQEGCWVLLLVDSLHRPPKNLCSPLPSEKQLQVPPTFNTTHPHPHLCFGMLLSSYFSCVHFIHLNTQWVPLGVFKIYF